MATTPRKLNAEEASKVKEQMASDFAMEMSGANWKLWQWALYVPFAIFPILLAITIQIVMASDVLQYVPVPKDIPPYLGISTPIIVAMVLTEVAYAAWTGKLKKYYRFNDSMASGFTVCLEQGVLALFRYSLTLGPYTFINHHFSFTSWNDNDMTWYHGILMFIVMDFGYYWAHRMGHEWNFMWAGHNVHHSSDEYNFFTALRQNFFFGIFGTAFYLPMAFLFPIRLFALHRAVNTLYQFWIHTRFINKLPWPIELIFNTPSHHRVHHGRNPQYIDKNYGGTLIIFDRLFGTFEPEGEEVVYGITHMPQSWSPFLIHFHHWVEMVEVVKRTPGLWRKLRVFLDLGPAYNYFLLNYETISYVPEKLSVATLKKYEVDVPNAPIKAYVIFHYAWVTAEMALLLVFGKHSANLFRFMVVAHLFLQEEAVSSLIDRKRYAASFNSLSALISYVFLLYTFNESSYFLLASILGGLFTAASIPFLFYFHEPLAKKDATLKAH